MYALTRRWGMLAAVVAVVVLAPRMRAEDPAPAARAMATLTVDGMS